MVPVARGARHEEEAMSSPLTSVMKFHHKLQACLVDDRAHIGLNTFPITNRRGRHVVIIKMALNAFARRLGMDQLDLTNDVYDQETADLVTTFKELHRPPILNWAHKIDNVVGKKTIAALDDELPFVK
jgi:hypothetical protein